MEASSSKYELSKSLGRIDDILDSSDNNYEDRKNIPARDSLTFTNGFYVDCSAIFIDMRGSKELNDSHKRPTLAKIYKSYISELVAILRNHEKVSEIFIEGDCVWGVFDTPYTTDIDAVLNIAAKASSLVDILNIKYKQKGYSTIIVGIGLSYGSSLCIKAGYKGSGINEVVWLGKLVGEAAKLCSYGNKTYFDKETMISDVFYNNLSDANKKLLEWNSDRACYHGNIVDVELNNWVQENEK